MTSRSEPVWQVVAWLPFLRWATCAVLWTAGVVAWLLSDVDLPLRTIAPLLLGAAICRTLATASEQNGWPLAGLVAGGALCADVALLTGLLDITGGPFNPFIVMFGVHVWLSAVSLPAAGVIAVAAVAATGFGWLVVDHVRTAVGDHHRLNDFPTHLFTMWVSGTAVAELVACYVARARAALALRQQQLDDARDRAVRSEHLAALTTLAAGAAHELSTPLGTIAVAARELQHRADRLAELLPPVDALKSDARLIRTEVDRCQAILDSMSARAQDGTASLAVPLHPVQIVDLVRDRLPHDQQGRIAVDLPPSVPAPAIAGAAIVQALSALLKNAFEASPAQSVVRMRFAQAGSMVRIEVHDHGTGMSSDVLRRAGQPFYSTKETGRGLGLGLFLTRALAEQAGGTLRFEKDGGTIAVLEIPATTALQEQFR